MNIHPKYCLTFLAFVGIALVTKAEASNSESANYTIRKDTLETAVPDTNKAVVVFPNPFIFILSNEQKK